jgi:hypothetical protein
VTFIHDDAAFEDLLRITAAKTSVAIALVEKDYWVTHTLWALQRCPFEIWFKGGTSLSKGFQLIQRFSEDLDLKITIKGAAEPNWSGDGTSAIATRKEHFDRIERELNVPGANCFAEPRDRKYRDANYRIEYPNKHNLASPMRQHVLIEAGNARVTPFVPRDLTSFVHETLSALDQLGDYDDNRPVAVRCLHPLVTLLEKIDILQKRVSGDRPPAEFVRHFDDAASIIQQISGLPPLPQYADVSTLAGAMVTARDLKGLPDANHGAFNLQDTERTTHVRAAYEGVYAMYWGLRPGLDRACSIIREWIAQTF